MKRNGRKRDKNIGEGHMTKKIDPEYTYSSMVSLKTIILLFLIAHIMGIKCLTEDLNSVHIQTCNQEKIYTIAGPKFGSLNGYLVIVDNALYGLQGSGNAWHKTFADEFHDMLSYTMSKLILTYSISFIKMVTMSLLQYLWMA